MNFKNIKYVASKSEKAVKVAEVLEKEYGIRNAEDSVNKIDLIIVLGGDGFMLESIHKYYHDDVIFYGINCGSLGFLMNKFVESNLLENINNGHTFKLNPLKVMATQMDGNLFESYAVNDICLERKTYKAVFLKVYVNNILRLNKLVGDGIIISSPIGSNAYTLSAGGVILPLDSKMLIMTPVNTFTPKGIRSIILPEDTIIKIMVDEPEIRGVTVVADLKKVIDVKQVEIMKDNLKTIRLLFDTKDALENKILENQFS